MKAMQSARQVAGFAKAQFLALVLGVFASFYGFAAMATTTPVQDVTAAIDAGKADAITIAVAVVVTLWAIWSIYLMRRKG